MPLALCRCSCPQVRLLRSGGLNPPQVKDLLHAYNALNYYPAMLLGVLQRLSRMSMRGRSQVGGTDVPLPSTARAHRSECDEVPADARNAAGCIPLACQRALRRKIQTAATAARQRFPQHRRQLLSYVPTLGCAGLHIGHRLMGLSTHANIDDIDGARHNALAVLVVDAISHNTSPAAASMHTQGEPAPPEF
eukprot:153047-Chlamydomonas_euryale.AAC.7